MRIVIPDNPPTTNHCFITRGRFRVLSPEARQWKEEVIKIVEAMHEDAPQGLLQVHMSFHSSRWYNKNGTVKRRDVSNLEKITIDAICEALHIDDSSIFRMTLEKVVDADERTEIMLESLQDNK